MLTLSWKKHAFVCHHMLLHASFFVAMLLLLTYGHYSSALSAGHLSMLNDEENIWIIIYLARQASNAGKYDLDREK